MRHTVHQIFFEKQFDYQCHTIEADVNMEKQCMTTWVKSGSHTTTKYIIGVVTFEPSVTCVNCNCNIHRPFSVYYNKETNFV